jgi:hypothetical protein
MENLLGKNEKSSRYIWKMRSEQMKNPFTKTGRICSVILKYPLSKNEISALQKWKIRSVKMENLLSRNEKFDQ